MSLRRMHPLRHPFLPVMLPWADTRLVPLSTVLEYLAVGYDAAAALTRDGFFVGTGCTKQVGRTTWYCPAAIWQANGLLPEAEVMRLLCATDGVVRTDERQRIDVAKTSALATTRRELDGLANQLSELRTQLAALAAQMTDLARQHALA